MEIGNNKILTIANKKEEQFLRKKTEEFDFSKWKRADIAELIKKMHRMMREANGIGLSANQIGLPYQFFVAEVPGDNGLKFYSIFNPKIEKVSKEKAKEEEGCLSIPGVYGDVDRPERIVISGQDKNKRPLKIKAWGLLARVFQHEIDHLNGILFIDKAKKLYEIHRGASSAI